MENNLIEAHKYSINNKSRLINDKKCGCSYCMKVFNPNEINECIDNNTTAICPYCGVGSIIGESSGYPITT